MKQCASCGVEKPLSEFYFRRDSQKHRNDCKSCTLIRNDKRRYGETRSRNDMPCEICGDVKETLCIDHNHDTGKIRGLLCANCNRAIGLLQDDPTILIKAAEYLTAAEG